MDNLLIDYLPLVIFIALAMVIGGALLVAPFVVAYSNPDSEKVSTYECGFNAFDDFAHALRCALLSRGHPLHHLRSGSGVPVSPGPWSSVNWAGSASGR